MGPRQKMKFTCGGGAVVEGGSTREKGRAKGKGKGERGGMVWWDGPVRATLLCRPLLVIDFGSFFFFFHKFLCLEAVCAQQIFLRKASTRR